MLGVPQDEMKAAMTAIMMVAVMVALKAVLTVDYWAA